MVGHNTKFKKQLLASVISSMTVAAIGAHAQQQEEEVIVTGIRASLQSSLDTKRTAKGVVDAITAEDIGKFPDSNLAESLQRITGVSIDRQNGEGFQITVRGFGPQFNQVTLNGRTMPAAQLLETGGLRTDRGFDMSNIASEGVSGVVVYKSGQADITSGGIGATVDLQTRKPMDQEGLNFTVGAKALSDTTNRVGSDITPELSGMLSFSNEMFGASVSFSHQERDSARTGVFTNGWNDTSVAWSGIGDIPNGTTADLVLGNEPAEGTQVNFTPGVRYNHMDVERERQNAQVTLQFRPNDRIEATLDYVSAEQEIRAQRSEMSFWFGGGAFPTSAVQFDGNTDAATALYWLTENTGNDDPADDYLSRDVNFGIQGGNLDNSLDSFGLNVKFDVNDSFSLTLDAHDSTAEALPGNDGPGNWYNVGIGAQGVSVQGFDNSGDFPVLVGVWDERDGVVGNVAGEPDIGDLSSTVRQINYDRTRSDLFQIKIDGSWEFADNGSIDFGVEMRDMEYTNQSSFDQTVLEGNWGASNPGDIAASGVTIEEFSINSLLDGYRTEMSSEAQTFFNNAYGGEGCCELRSFGDVAYIGDANALGAVLSSNAGLDWVPNPVDSVNREITEEINAAYLQVNLTGELGDMPFDVLAGVRYEGTDIESRAQVAAASVIWQGDNDFLAQGGSAADAPLIVDESSYNHVLPSLSMSLNVTDDIVTRMAFSKTIARADYAVLQTGVSNISGPIGGPTIIDGNNGTATNGNVALLPVESNNFDLSVEWYYADASYASIGYFDKRVPNFIGNQEIVTIAENTRDPSNGPRAIAAVAELEARGLEVNQQNLFRMVASLDDGSGGCVNNPQVDVELCGADFDDAPYEDDIVNDVTGWETGVDIVALSEDPLSVLDASTPVNAQDARITGFELAVQHFFGETGFGLQANYTLVNADVGYDISETGGTPQFALTGLSDSANLVFIYDKNDFQARLAYNWREEFLDSTNVGGNEPQFTEDYAQVDFSVSYSFLENFTVGLEGINIFEEDRRQFGRTSNQLRDLQVYGARYALTGRYTF